MTDVSHELGSLRYVVDSSLSSKVAMFNNQANQHKQSQLLNPFSNNDGRCSPKPTFSKDEYGKPLAGSLTEMRGQKANMHVMKEMLELCQIIDSEGYQVNDEPNMRVIPFGELFNIYNFISDKVVGILLRARKHKLVDFEGEILFQRRDDDVPVFLLKPIQDIRHEIENKIDEMKRASSPAPQATSVLLDKSAHLQKLQEAGLVAPDSRRNSKSRSTSPAVSKASTLTREIGSTSVPITLTITPSTPAPTQEAPQMTLPEKIATEVKIEASVTAPPSALENNSEISIEASSRNTENIVKPKNKVLTETSAIPRDEVKHPESLITTKNTITSELSAASENKQKQQEFSNLPTDDIRRDINNNNGINNSISELPTIFIEATAVHMHSGSVRTSPEGILSNTEQTAASSVVNTESNVA